MSQCITVSYRGQNTLYGPHCARHMCPGGLGASTVIVHAWTPCMRAYQLLRSTFVHMHALSYGWPPISLSLRCSRLSAPLPTKLPTSRCTYSCSHSTTYHFDGLDTDRTIPNLSNIAVVKKCACQHLEERLPRVPQERHLNRRDRRLVRMVHAGWERQATA